MRAASGKGDFFQENRTAAGNEMLFPRPRLLLRQAFRPGVIIRHSINHKIDHQMKTRLHRLVHAFCILIFAICGSFSISAFATTNRWVYFDSPGHLSYRTWSNGNRIMDFSSSGYMGGGVAIPTVATVVTVNPSGGDDTTAIKNAISTVAGQPLVNGFRGAVQLGA